MTLGVKLLIAGGALAGTSCGGYMIYKKTSSSSEEKTTTEGPKVDGETPTVSAPSPQVTSSLPS